MDVLIVKIYIKCKYFLCRFWCNELKINIFFKKLKSKEYKKNNEKIKKNFENKCKIVVY